LSASACARTGIGTDFERGDSLEHAFGGNSDAAVGCSVNAECDEDSICIERECVFFGECLRDWHCGDVPRYCETNVCKGEYPPAGEYIPVLCEINSDCGAREYCVDGTCRRGIECLNHGHCDPAFACLGTTCLSAF
jgi:hypothetical protein